MKKGIYQIKVKNLIQVRFHEVDAYNIVHNVHYFNFFDIGRFTLVDIFLRKEKPPEIGSYLFLVLKSNCKYLNPAQMGDELIVETVFNYNPDRRNARIELFHSIVKKANNLQIAEGATVLGISNRNYQLLYQIPEEITAYLNARLEHYRECPAPNLKINWAAPRALQNNKLKEG